MPKGMRAMVLAAGVGSRLEPLTTQIPKPLVPVANRPVLEHIFALLRKHQITDVISNLHYMSEQIESYFGDGSAFGINLTFRTEKQLTGDAGGVRVCKEFFQGETFIVLMGDLITDADLTRIVSEHKSKKALATIAIKQVDDVSQFGVALTDKNGFITGFQEKPKPEEALSNYASTGIYILEPEIFNHIPQAETYGFGRQLFPSLVKAGLPVLGSIIDDCYWSDVGTIDQYRLSNFDAVHGRINIEIPATGATGPGVQINGKLLLGQHCSIAPGVTIDGTVVVGDNCRIAEGTRIKDSVLWSDTQVGRDSQLKNCVLGRGLTLPQGTSVDQAATVDLTKLHAFNKV